MASNEPIPLPRWRGRHERRLACASCAIALAASACGGRDSTAVAVPPGAGAPPGSAAVRGSGEGAASTAPGALAEAEAGPLYLATSWVTNVETTNTYVALFDSLELDRLDFARAIEIPGYGDAWVYNGALYVADGEAPRVTRYRLEDDGSLRWEVQIDFSAYGLLGAAFWDQEFLSPTKAYLSNVANLEYVVWNPTTMEITGTVPWPELDFGDGLEPFNSYTDRGGVVLDGYFFHGFYGHDESFSSFGESSVVAVYDIASDELVSTIDVPCPMMDVASLGDDGYIYLSGWSYMPVSVLAGYTARNCAARIDAGARALDPSWLLDYSQLGSGDQGSALRAVSGNDGVFAVFKGTGVPVTEGMDMWDLDAGEDDWELYGIDLAERSVAPTGIAMSDGSYYESHVGDRYFVYLPGSSSTRVYERTPSGYVPKLQASGWMSRLFQLR